MAVVINELAERFACRLDNARVTPEQRIACGNPAARSAWPLIVGM